MIKADLVKQVMDSLELPQGKASDAVNTVFDAMRGALTRGERIELRGFGVFIVKPRMRGIGRNPKTRCRGRHSAGQDDSLQAGQALRTI